MKDVVVEFEDVTFSYNGISAVERVNASIYRGDYIGLIGPNGAGKTTLIKVLLGLLRPSSGVVRLFGVPQQRFRDWRKIGYVPQKATAFDPHFPATVEEVVAMGRFALAGVGRRLGPLDRKRIHEAMEMVGIDPLAARRIGELSSGQQQRVFIARALASDPELLILDEPTTGVDAASQHEFYDFMHDLNALHGITLVLISHDTGVVSSHVSRLMCINRTLMAQGCTLDFMAPPHGKRHVHTGGHAHMSKVRHMHP